METFNIKNFELLCDTFKNQSKCAQVYLNNLPKIEQAFNLMANEESKSTYLSELFLNLYKEIFDPKIAHLISKDGNQAKKAKKDAQEAQNNPFFKYFPTLKNADDLTLQSEIHNLFIKEQYTYKNSDDIVYIGPEKGDICIDAGAFLGETAIWMAKKYNVKHVFAFEIVQQSINKAIKSVEMAQVKDNITFVNQGLFNQQGQLYIHYKEDSLNSSFVIQNIEKYTEKYGNDGVHSVIVNTIDNFLAEKNSRIDFIKMDIEGAEYEALLGAKESIEKYQPKLAICTYHYWRHLFEIPCLIKELNSNYKIYLKKFDYDCETVCFAI